MATTVERKVMLMTSEQEREFESLKYKCVSAKGFERKLWLADLMAYWELLPIRHKRKRNGRMKDDPLAHPSPNLRDHRSHPGSHGLSEEICL